jgi:enoyl-CoA hydratase/carnithine racemase
MDNVSAIPPSIRGARVTVADTQVLLTEQHGRVRLLTLARPAAANAFSSELYLATAAAFEAAAADDEVSVVVLTGQGKAFSAGTDLKEMASIVPEPGGAVAPPAGGGGVPFQTFMDALIAFPKPLIAAVNGVGVGLGLTMLPHCDLVLVSDGARLLAPFTTMGVAPEAASSYLLARRMGTQQATYALLTSEWITAAQAVDSGLALKACAPDELVPEALRIAQLMAGKPLGSLIATKRLVRDAEREGVARARELEGQAFAELLRAPAMREKVLGQLPSR